MTAAQSSLSSTEGGLSLNEIVGQAKRRHAGFIALHTLTIKRYPRYERRFDRLAPENTYR